MTRSRDTANIVASPNFNITADASFIFRYPSTEVTNASAGDITFTIQNVYNGNTSMIAGDVITFDGFDFVGNPDGSLDGIPFEILSVTDTTSQGEPAKAYVTTTVDNSDNQNVIDYSTSFGIGNPGGVTASGTFTTEISSSELLTINNASSNIQEQIADISDDVDAVLPIDLSDGGNYLTNDGSSPIWRQIAPNKNYLLNGDFEINQRGLTSTPIIGQNGGQIFGTDRWKSYNDSTSRYSLVSIAPNTEARRNSDGSVIGIVPTRQALRAASNTTSFANGSRMSVGQKLELLDTVPLRGKTLTLSFYVKFSNDTFTSSAGGTSFGDFRYGLFYNTATTDAQFNELSVAPDSFSRSTSQNGFLPTQWTRVQLTTLSPVPTNANNIYVGFGFANQGYTSTEGALSYEITAVKLEEGPVATPFVRSSDTIQAELAACQRYYWRNATTANSASYGQLLHGFQTATTLATFMVHLPVPMRAYPTSLGWSGLEVSDEINYGSAPSSLSLSIYRSDFRSIAITAIISSAGAQFRACTLRRSFENNGFLEISAEL
jgi:hypothetical protein